VPAPPIQYIIEGGHRLSGTIEPSGNKNAALPIIAAALLTEHPVTLDNVPRIRDTETLVELIRSVGASAEWRKPNTLAIHAKLDELIRADENARSELTRLDEKEPPSIATQKCAHFGNRPDPSSLTDNAG